MLEHQQSEAQTGSRELSATEAHDILSNQRRLAIVAALREEGELSARELSERIAAQETGSSPPPRDARRSVYVSMTQTHLSRLERNGIVTVEDGTVRLDEGAEQIYFYMESVPRYGITWNEFTGGCALLGALMVLASVVGVPPFGAVDPALWGLAALGSLVALAGYRSYRQSISIRSRFGE